MRIDHARIFCAWQNHFNNASEKRIVLKGRQLGSTCSNLYFLAAVAAGQSSVRNGEAGRPASLQRLHSGKSCHA